MGITETQVHDYQSDGYLFVRNCFSDLEIETVTKELKLVFSQVLPGTILEKDSQNIRSVYGAHESSAVLHSLAHHPRVVLPARRILSGDVYIHQFKVNVKAAFKGDVWHWHQDFIYWLHEDGMQKPSATTVAIFLDEVNEFNGPLLLVPRSHRLGVIDPSSVETSSSWLGDVVADLKYCVPPEQVAKLVRAHGLVAPKGPPGSVLFFHCNLVHGSAPNMSPFDRRIAYVTFNRVDNPLMPVPNPRPAFLSNRDSAPISTCSQTALLPMDPPESPNDREL